MRMHLTLLVLSSLAPGLAAQGAGLPPFFPPEATVYGPNEVGLEDAFWPDDFAEGHDFEDVALGDLDGDGRVDGLMLSGSTLVFLPSLDAHTVLLTVTVAGQPLVDVSAFALVRRTDKLAVAVSDGQGTRLLRQQGAGTFVEDLDFGSPAGWQDLRRLVAVDQDGDGLDELFGLSANGLQVLRRWQSAPWQSASALDLPGVSANIAPLEWDGDALLEVAAVSTTGLVVVDDDGLGGAVVYDRGSSLGPGHLARLRMPSGEGHDRVAWLVDTGSNAVLSALGADGYESWLVTSHQPSSLAAHDLDGDGDSDLVLTLRTSFDVLVLEQDDSSFDPGAALVVIDTSPGASKTGVSGNGCVVAAADVNEDGHLDLAIPSKARGSLVLATSGSFTSGGPFFLPMQRGLLPGSFSGCADPNDGALELTVRALYEDFPPAADGWRLSVWVQERGDLPPAAASASSCSPPLELTQIPGTDEHVLRFRAEVLPEWTPPYAERWVDDERLFHFKAEPVVRLDPGTALDDLPRGPALLGTLSFDLLALDAVPVSDDWLGSGGDELDASVDCGGGAALPTGDQPIGGFYSVKRIPTLLEEIPVLTDACLIDLGPPGDGGEGGEGGEGGDS